MSFITMVFNDGNCEAAGFGKEKNQSILLSIWLTDWNCCHYHCISEEARFLFVKWSYSTIEKIVLEMMWLLSYFAQNTASTVNQIIWIIHLTSFWQPIYQTLPKYTNKYFTTMFINCCLLSSLICCQPLYINTSLN